MPDEQIAHLLEMLEPLTPSARAMFGGHGIYADRLFFAIAFDGRLYFRVDEKTRRSYEDAGMTPFQPPGRPPIRSYYEVPDDVVASATSLRAWASAASAAAVRST